MSAPNVRLTDPLKADAARYARSLGISLNALVAVAVRDYLDARRQEPGEEPASSPPVARPAGPRTVQKPAPAIAAAVPKVGRNEPCPCGSGKKYKQCHGGAA